MWEFSVFAKKNCYFKHSAVWVSLFQLVFLRFLHRLNFHMQLKKNTIQPKECFRMQSESRLGCCRGNMESPGWQWSWCLTVWLWGSGTRQPHGAHPASPGLLLAAADPRPSTHSGKPWLAAIWWRCWDLVPLFLGFGMASGACWSPLVGQRTSGLLDWFIAKMLKIAQRKWREHPLHAVFCTQTLLFPKISSNNSSWGALN